MRGLALLLLLALSACGLFNRQAAAPRYIVGAPYQSDGVWRYPREDFTFIDTGLATVYERRGLTASGEAFDATAMAAATGTHGCRDEIGHRSCTQTTQVNAEPIDASGSSNHHRQIR